MERTVEINGREVKFRATAAVPRLYRIKFHRDIIRDINDVKKAIDKAEQEEKPIPMEALEVFENMAYTMAKHADPTGTPSSPDEWLDQFETMSIYEIFPVISELWVGNMKTTVDAKKKPARHPSGR